MNVFDILGPVMIGPSSSHTAGAVRIGLITRTLLGSEPVKATILLHGSFAKTYKGHGTDKALIGGILGMQTDDSRIRQAPEIARQRGLSVEIITEDIDGAHPNTARISLSDASGHKVSLQGSSIGGGNIHITEVNGMPVSITGQHTTLIILHRDAPVAIALKNILGLVCDPVAGLVEIPCIKRNASGTAGAFAAAELALAGIKSAIPADEVIWAMKKIGDSMSSSLKETAEGGLAATPTGKKLHEQVFGPSRNPGTEK